MMGNEDTKFDPSDIVRLSLSSETIKKQVINDYEIFEVDRQNNIKRQVKLDKAKNTFIVYTFHSNLYSIPEKKDKAMLFTAYVNEQLSVTGLDFLIDNGEFRYKSSQSYPKGVDFGPLLRYFYDKHDKHFDKLLECIDVLLKTEQEAAICANLFLDKIKSD